MIQSDITASLLYALWEQPLGRRTLVQRTHITESTVRTHLNKLRAKGWVAFAKAGTTLTGEAKSAFGVLFQSVLRVCVVELNDMALSGHQVAAHVRVGSAPEAVWQLRDRAIQGGADGALLLRFDQALVFADDPNPLSAEFPQSASALSQAFSELKGGDWVLVAFAASNEGAHRGLWSMLVEMLNLHFQNETSRRQH